jgi:hypothetical protein
MSLYVRLGRSVQNLTVANGLKSDFKTLGSFSALFSRLWFFCIAGAIAGAPPKTIVMDPLNYLD